MTTDQKNSRPMNGARYLAEAMQAYGVDHIFFMDAILRRTLAECGMLNMKRILAHSEKGAVYMADGYARISRKPTVVMAQSVGAANLAAGLQDARLFGAPLIAMTGRHAAPVQYRNAYQELPHEPMFDIFVKASYRVDAVSQLPYLVRQAFREATTGRPSPVHLDVLGNTGALNDFAELADPVVVEPVYSKVPPYRPQPDAEQLKRAVAAIQAARQPVIFAGAGAMMSGAEEAIRRLCAKGEILLVGTLDAKAVLPTRHPLNGGIAGTYSCHSSNKLLAEADLVVFVGCETGDQATNNYTLPLPGVTVIHIDTDPVEISRNFPNAIPLCADPQATVEAITALMPAAKRPEWLARNAALQAEWYDYIATHYLSDALPIRPQRLCKELGDWLPENAIVVADTGFASQWTGSMMEMRSTDQSYIRAAGSLGWSFPAALGAKCAAPDRPVVCVTGDGGFMYHLAEMETARRWNIPTITIVNNNGRLAQGLRNLTIAHQGLDDRRMQDLFVYAPMDFANIARSFGCNGIRVEKIEQLRPAFEAALASGQPTVIDVVSDADAQADLPWVPPKK